MVARIWRRDGWSPQSTEIAIASSAAITGTKGRIVAGVLLFAATAALAWGAHGISAPRREMAELARRLPDLPALHSATRHRDLQFPVTRWAHRVNSVRRARILGPEYGGLEIDLVYDSAAGRFDVGHPPVPSAGISLEQVLAALPEAADRYFWLDFKNLTPANAEPACARLLAITRTHAIGPDHIIVESTVPAALSCFTRAGFITSYYLFPEVGPQAMSRDQLVGYYREVAANLAASQVNALSSGYRSLPFIEKYFPGADALLWYLERDDPVRRRATLEYLESRAQVKVILVRVGSAGYR